MQVISYTQACKSLEAVIDQVIEHQEPELIRRREGGNVVLLPEQTYSSMQETLHLFSTTANAQRLLESVDELNAGKTKDGCAASFTNATN
jgi:antitoxin YefM